MESLNRSLIVAAENMDRAAEYLFAAGAAVVFSSARPGESTANQDSAALIRIDAHRGVLVVADGMGSTRGAGEASRVAVETVRKSIEKRGTDGSEFRSAILDGIEQANRDVLEMGVGAGTTLAVLEVNGSYARPYHVGDSLILVVGGRGKVKFQNIAHSPTGYAVEAGMIDESDALQHNERHIVSNYVGSADMRIEIGPEISISERDTLLVASDGLSDNLHTEEIVDVIRKGPLENVGSSLVEVCRGRMEAPTEDAPGKPDDLTFVVYRP